MVNLTRVSTAAGSERAGAPESTLTRLFMSVNSKITNVTVQALSPGPTKRSLTATIWMTRLLARALFTSPAAFKMKKKYRPLVHLPIENNLIDPLLVQSSQMFTGCKMAK